MATLLCEIEFIVLRRKCSTDSLRVRTRCRTRRPDADSTFLGYRVAVEVSDSMSLYRRHSDHLFRMYHISRILGSLWQRCVEHVCLKAQLRPRRAEGRQGGCPRRFSSRRTGATICRRRAEVRRGLLLSADRRADEASYSPTLS